MSAAAKPFLSAPLGLLLEGQTLLASNVSLSKETVPKICVPQKSLNKPVLELCLLMFIDRSLKHSQIGILDKKLGWGPWRPGIRRLS